MTHQLAVIVWTLGLWRNKLQAPCYMHFCCAAWRSLLQRVDSTFLATYKKTKIHVHEGVLHAQFVRATCNIFFLREKLSCNSTFKRASTSNYKLQIASFASSTCRRHHGRCYKAEIVRQVAEGWGEDRIWKKTTTAKQTNIRWRLCTSWEATVTSDTFIYS